MDILDILLSLIVLIIMEIVLGIDNLVFLSILADKLPRDNRAKARRIGLLLAWVTRLIFLASAVWIVHLTKPFITLGHFAFSVRDLFLLMGGIFLIYKATQEIHGEFDLDLPADVSTEKPMSKSAKFHHVVIQIALMDIIFSIDSVLTAIGLTTRYWIMATAISVAIVMMIYASASVSNIIEKHPSLKMLALSFLILIGMVLIADGLSFHVPRGYVYCAMGFSLSVEMLNLTKRARRQRKSKG